MRLKYILLLLVILTGCQSTPDTAATPSDSTSSVTQKPAQADAIQKAALDVTIAREFGVIWMVRDTSTRLNPVSLERLLEQASHEFGAGNIPESQRLAVKISTMVALALEQDHLNSSAKPQYTFQN